MKPLTLISASREAEKVVQHNAEMLRLYKLAVRQFGEGELRTAVLNLMSDAVIAKQQQEQVFADHNSLLSFCCGAWIQFLLVEIAGVNRNRLQDLAKTVFFQDAEPKSVH